MACQANLQDLGHGIRRPVSTSGDYDFKKRPPSKRSLEDDQAMVPWGGSMPEGIVKARSKTVHQTRGDSMSNTENLGDDAVIDRILPWSEHVPDSRKLSPKVSAKATAMTDDPIIDIDPTAFDTEGWNTLGVFYTPNFVAYEL